MDERYVTDAYEDEDIAIHIVIEKGKHRPMTLKELEVCVWCFGKQLNRGISEIGYATFEMEPIKKEWIDEAIPLFLVDLKSKYLKWKKKKTLWKKEVEAM